MFDADRRPDGRLFYWLLAVAIVTGSGLTGSGAAAVPQSGAGSTTISDTVYMADGSAASGTLIITWPAFVTASGTAVAGGTTSTTLGANGALSVTLAPNAGASPADVYYTVVYQLGPGEVRTEYWVVPTTSPANLATVRTAPGSGAAGQPVSMQYVNSQLAAKANDSAVVHVGGTETISGAKTFTAAPSVPTPTSTGQVANKAYVDQSISNVGGGNFLPTVGGTMTGPITLPANPSSALQATPKQYVDQGLSGKADLISGLVPASELGSGTASAGNCLLGNGTWGACGSGGGPAGVANGSALVSNGVGQASVYQAKAIADVADYPSVVGDGATDNCASFQAFIDANPGRRLLVRKVAAATRGGGSYSTIDYYSSCTFHLKYNGTIIEGNANEMWQGAPVFLFAAGVTGFQIDSSCMGCALRDIEEVGGGKPAYSSNACYSSNNPAVYPFTGAADGVLVYGGEPTLERVEANCNPRDGIHIDGTNVNVGGYLGQPDVWEVKGGQGDANFHDNLYIHGGDSNAGIESRFLTYNAGGWGVQDDANLGNTHIASFTTANGRDAGIAAKATSAITSISCASYTCSVVAATPVASIQNHIWIVVGGTTNYNGVYWVTGYTDTQHFSFSRVAASVATETSGTVGVDGSTHLFANATRTVADGSCTVADPNSYFISQSAQFGKDTQPGAVINIAGAGIGGTLLSTTIASVVNEYTVTLPAACATTVNNAQATYGGGISHGSMMSNTTAATNSWITPYMEGDQPGAKMTSANYVYGGDISFQLSNGYTPTQFANGEMFSQYLQVVDPIDSVGFVQMQCGATANQDCGLNIFNYNGTAGWKLYAVGSSADQAFWIRDNAAGGIIPFATQHGSTTDISAATNVTLNPGAGHLNILNTGTEFANLASAGTQCLHVSSTGIVSGTGTDCGSSGGSSAFSGLTPGTNASATPWSFAPATALGGSTSNVSMIGALNDSNTGYVLNVDTPAGTSGAQQSPFRVGTNTYSQLQVCNFGTGAAAFGGTVIGSQVACPSMAMGGTTPTSKLVIQSGQGPHQLIRAWQSATGMTGDFYMMNTATAAGTGFNFFEGWTGVTGADTWHTGGTRTFAIQGDGSYVMNGCASGSYLKADGTGCGTPSGGSGGGMVYPSAGIPQSTGSAWGSSLAAPASAIMGVADTQTVSNKDFTSSTNVFSGMGGRSVTSGTTDSIVSTDAGHFVIYNDGATNVTTTVADAGGTGLNHFPTIPVVQQGTGTITLNRTSSSTINGGTTATIYPQSSCTLSSMDNANWLLRCDALLDSAGHLPAAASVYPAAGVTNSTGSGWGTSYAVGTGALNLLALDGSANLTLPGNLTVNGTFSVAGPWSVSSAPSTGAMGGASSGHSSLGISNDGNFYISANAGTPSQVCTLATGCGGSGAVTSVFGRTGAVVAASGDYTAAQVTGAVPNTITVNGHALSANVTVSASDLTTGTLPHAQLPALVSGDIPANAANTSGTAANLSGTPALPNGTTATTQAAGDSSTKLATTAYVQGMVASGTPWFTVPYSSSGSFSFPASSPKAAVFGLVLPYPLTTSKVIYRIATADNTANTYALAIYNAAGTLVVHYAAAGTSFAPTASAVVPQSWAEGATTLQPGKYFLLLTSSCTASCATLNAENAAFVTWYSNALMTITTGGTAPATITTTATGSESFAATVPALIVE